MFNIIKSDLYRLIRSKGFYIAIIVIIAMSALSIVGMSAGRIGLAAGVSTEDVSSSEVLSDLAGNNVMDSEKLAKLIEAKTLNEIREVQKSFGGFELDKEIIAQNANLYYIFIVFVVIVLAKDFSNKSIKNTLSSAISRKKYYFSKLLLILGISTCAILFNTYFTFFLNIAVNGKEFASSIGNITKITLYQLPLLYGIICLLVCIAFTTRKTSMFNTISIPFIMVFQLVVMTITSLFKIKADWFYKFELQNALINLTNNPINSYILKCSLLGIGYMIVFSIIGYYLFKKSEIK